MNKSFDIRINAVQQYLKSKKSLRNTSKELGIPYQTLHRWVKWYKNGGIHRLEISSKRVWDRVKKERVAFLKEKNPGLTVRTAKGKKFKKTTV